MENRIREALDAVHAEEELKESTLRFLAEKARPARRSPMKRLVPAVCCALLLVFLAMGGYGWYMQPVAAVSIEGSSSVELALNRFDRVVEVTEYDEQALPQALSLRNMTCEEAVTAILDAGENGTEEVWISVAGETEEQTRKLETALTACTQGKYENVTCSGMGNEQAQEAAELGLPLGKYRVYQQILEWEPDFAVEEASSMTMRQLTEYLEALTGEESTNENQAGNQAGNQGQNGSQNSGNGQGGSQNQGQNHGQGNGYGKHQ